MWGYEPWENDLAADWFNKFNNTLGIRDYIICNLEKDENGYFINESEKLRAVVYILLQLCKVYCWPINSLDADLSLGIEVLTFLISDEEYCDNDELKNKLIQEKKILMNRLI